VPPTIAYAVGSRIPTRSLTTISGGAVEIPDPEHTVHLQFRRFAGCPVCSTHLREFTIRHTDLINAGVREVVVFHSTAEELRRYRADLPFDVVADPERVLYNEFGVTRGLGSVLHPRTALAGLRGLAAGAPLSAALNREEDHLGRPADFLIAPDATVLRAQLGRHAADGWSVDEVLAALD
jgi:peroxiredoxin